MTETTGAASRASGSAPTKSKTGPLEIERVIRDEEVVRLKVAGYTHQEAANAVGLASKSSVTDILTKWMDERGPSGEIVDQYRQLQGAQCDQLTSAHWEAGTGKRGPDGEWIIPPDPSVIAPLVRIMERKAKLYGLDMPTGVNVSLAPTAEQVYEYIFKDLAIDVEGEEIEDEDASGVLGEAEQAIRDAAPEME